MANIHALTLQAASTLSVTVRLYDDSDKSYGPFTFNIGTTAKTIRQIATDNSWAGTGGLPTVINWSIMRAVVPSTVGGTINFNYSDGVENPNSVGLGILAVGSKIQPPFDLAGTVLDSGFRPLSSSARWSVMSWQTGLKSISSQKNLKAQYATTRRWRVTIPAFNTTDSTGATQEQVMLNAGGSEQYINVRVMIVDPVTGASYPVLSQEGDRVIRCKLGFPTSAEFIGPKLAAGASFYVHCDIYCDTAGTDRLPYNCTFISQNHEGVETHATNLTDRTLPASSTWNPANTGYGFIPIVEAVPSGSVLSVAFLGDSRTQAMAGDDSHLDRDWETTCWVAKALNTASGRVSGINLGAGGARLNKWVANDFRDIRERVRYMKTIGVTRCLVYIGYNDFSDGRTSTQAIADLALLDAFLAENGITMWVATDTPGGVTTTDDYLTVGNQTASAGIEAQRVPFNASTRTVYAGRYSEFADALESARDSGKYKAADAVGTWVATTGGDTTNFYTTTPTQLMYGEYRNIILVFAGNVTAAIAGQRRKASNTTRSGGNSRVILNSALASAPASGDNAVISDPKTVDGLHHRTKSSQNLLATAAAGFLGG